MYFLKVVPANKIRIVFVQSVFIFVLGLLINSCDRQLSKVDQAKLDWGKEQLISALHNIGLNIQPVGKFKVYVGVDRSSILLDTRSRREEGFGIKLEDNHVQVIGYDAAGAMYGCLALAEQIAEKQSIPEFLELSDNPQMNLRGTCILLMKLGTYNYPVTPEVTTV